MSIPTLSGIDHFHLTVNDKQEASMWYQSVLGFRVFEPLAFWDTEDGPLTLADASGLIHLALFKRRQQAPSSSIAFKATGEEFLDWKKHLNRCGLQVRVADHQVSWSLYFSDPDANLHEITSYDYSFISKQAKV